MWKEPAISGRPHGLQLWPHFPFHLYHSQPSDLEEAVQPLWAMTFPFVQWKGVQLSPWVLPKDDTVALRHSSQWEVQRWAEVQGWAEVWGYNFLRLCKTQGTPLPASQLPPLANEERHMLLIPAPALTLWLSKIPEQTGFLLGIYTY